MANPTILPDGNGRLFLKELAGDISFIGLERHVEPRIALFRVAREPSAGRGSRRVAKAKETATQPTSRTSFRTIASIASLATRYERDSTPGWLREHKPNNSSRPRINLSRRAIGYNRGSFAFGGRNGYASRRRKWKKCSTDGEGSRSVRIPIRWPRSSGSVAKLFRRSRKTKWPSWNLLRSGRTLRFVMPGEACARWDRSRFPATRLWPRARRASAVRTLSIISPPHATPAFLRAYTWDGATTRPFRRS